MLTSLAMQKISFYKPDFGLDEKVKVVSVIEEGRLSQGKYVDLLEKEFAEYVGAKHAVAVDSCSSALHLCVYLSDYKDFDIPTLTFPSVANAVIHCGGRLSFRDNVYVGRSYILQSANFYDVIDSAHEVHRGCASDVRNIRCFSFYTTKQLASAEGGMITCYSDEMAEKFRLYRSHGKVGSNWNYDTLVPGFKYNMTNLQAVIAREQLKKLDGLNEKRRVVRDKYNELLELDNESLHLYRIEVQDRDRFIGYMNDCGIECSAHYARPLHMMKAYADGKSYPESEREASVTASLPFYASLTDEQIDEIVERVRAWKNRS